MISYEYLNSSDEKSIQRMSSLASAIIKDYYDPLLGSEQNDYMISLFQSVAGITKQLAKGYEYYFIKDDVEDIGFTAFYPKENELYLSKLYLKKESRGHGYGKVILEFIKESAEKKGLKRITLNVNKYNQTVNIYKHLGFIIARSEKNDIGHGFYMDDFVMEYNW